MNTNAAEDNTLLASLSLSVAMLARRGKPIKTTMAVARVAGAALKAVPALSQVAAMELAKTVAGVFDYGTPEQADADVLEICSRRGYGADVAEGMSKAWRGSVDGE